MKILAVDYGDARTGLAISDASELLATPLPQIEEKSMNKAAAAILEAARAQKAEMIVVGLPRNMDGTEGSRAQKTRKMAAILERAGCRFAFATSAAPPSPLPPSSARWAPSAKSAKRFWTR